jgi:hypothetical protein
MSVSISPKLTIGSGVQEFLKEKDAEAAFQAVCECIRECFPQTLAINARLEEDHDEPGWWRVVVDVALPDSLSVDVWLDQDRQYYERLYERIPLAQTPLFVKLHEFRAE